MTGGTHYAALQVARDASADDLRRAYHRLARLHHPDKQHGAAPEAETAFRRVQDAYEALRDPAARAAYDRALAQEELLQKRDVEDVRIADEVCVADMRREQLDDGDVLFSHVCRCGDAYEISEDELQDGIDVVPCNGCSLNIRVLPAQL